MTIQESSNRKGLYTAEKLADKHYVVYFQSRDKNELPVKIATYKSASAAVIRAEKEARIW